MLDGSPPLAEAARGTGRTSAQLRDAPRGAIFIWGAPHDPSYARALARSLGRTDLTIMGLPDPERLRGMNKPVVIDHAAAVSRELLHVAEMANARLAR